MRTTFDPWKSLAAFQDDVKHLFRHLDSGRKHASGSAPKVNVWTSDRGLVLEFAVPGFSPEDLDITIEGDELHISGKKDEADLPEGTTVVRREAVLNQFERSYKLPFAIDGQKTEASFHQGLLTLTLVRPDAEQPVKITVRQED